MRVLANIICYTAAGVLIMGVTGLGTNTWQFWILYLLVILANVAGIIEGRPSTDEVQEDG